MQWWDQPFFQVALPIVVAFAIATWFQSKHVDGLYRHVDGINRRIDDVNRRIDDLRDAFSKRLDAIEARLGRIEDLLANHDRRITVLEERTSPLARR